MQVTYESLV